MRRAARIPLLAELVAQRSATREGSRSASRDNESPCQGARPAPSTRSQLAAVCVWARVCWPAQFRTSLLGRPAALLLSRASMPADGGLTATM